MTDVLLAAYVAIPVAIIAAALVAIAKMNRDGRHPAHPGE